jgi:hypothetical protein
MILVNHDYHIIEFNHYIPNEVMSWLETKFGVGDGSRWFLRHNKLYFSNAKDHLMFVLAWGDK